ncbi:MAG TPA: cytochrome P450 [Acidimicrobiales bacterium]|nr:cytochrome P450 [Acidimicrobiales bacterium]
MELSDINLLDRDRFTDGVPHDWFTYLRKNAPIYRHPEPDGPGFWVFTKHDDVVAIGRDAKHFSSDQGRGGVVGLEDPTAEQMEAQRAQEGGNLMLTMDPPPHTRYRKLVNRGFTPRMIGMLEDHIREVSATIVEEGLAKGEVDFVVDMASELPLIVIAELMGVPHEDRHKIFEWSNRMIGSEDPEYIVDQEEVQAAFVEMFLYAQQLAEKRRAEPRDDIISKLLSADVDGDQLTEMDFNLFFLLLAVAGNETTRNAISHGMNAFLENPDQYDRLVAHPELVDTAVEEIIRWASPVMYFRRNVTEDIEYKGHQLKAGEKVSIWYASANRDEDVITDPFKFDVGRNPNPHVAFGGGGPHHCLGSNLARMEVKHFYAELIKRVAKVEAVGKPALLRSNFIGGIKHLPVRFHAGKVPAAV